MINQIFISMPDERFSPIIKKGAMLTCNPVQEIDFEALQGCCVLLEKNNESFTGIVQGEQLISLNIDCAPVDLLGVTAAFIIVSFPKPIAAVLDA